MDWLRRFWNQPNKAYRNAFIAFFLLGWHFVIPSMGYLFDPHGSIVESFNTVNRITGQANPLIEDTIVLRILGAGNVFTLGFMCFMLGVNPKRFYPVLVPLCVMKAYASLSFLAAFIIGAGGVHHAVYLGTFIWDGANVLMFLYFAGRARRSLLAPDAPRPLPYWFAEATA